MRFLLVRLCVVTALLSPISAWAEDLKVAVTTSFHNSGLSEILLPAIKKDLDLDVHLLVVGTGQALKLGRQGDVDAILVHSKADEQTFVEDGYAPHRREVMYNDFVLIGPGNDSAGIRELKMAGAALQKIQQNQSEFVSRGDDSGTHRKELSLWQAAGLEPQDFDVTWYKAAGAGMGATLNMASSLNAYVMADRASWLNFKNKRKLKLLFSGDPVLFNQYAFLPVSKQKHPHVKRSAAAKLEDWLTSKRGQKMIADYRLAGEQLFVPNAVSVQTGS